MAPVQNRLQSFPVIMPGLCQWLLHDAHRP